MSQHRNDNCRVAGSGGPASPKWAPVLVVGTHVAVTSGDASAPSASAHRRNHFPNARPRPRWRRKPATHNRRQSCRTPATAYPRNQPPCSCDAIALENKKGSHLNSSPRRRRKLAHVSLQRTERACRCGTTTYERARGSRVGSTGKDDQGSKETRGSSSACGTHGANLRKERETVGPSLPQSHRHAPRPSGLHDGANVPWQPAQHATDDRATTTYPEFTPKEPIS